MKTIVVSVKFAYLFMDINNYISHGKLRKKFIEYYGNLFVPGILCDIILLYFYFQF